MKIGFPFDDQRASRIRLIQNAVRAMLDERRQIAVTEGRPGTYWSDFCSYFDYMLDLPPHAYAKLRLHTYHLTGDTYPWYYFGDARALNQRFDTTRYTQNLPPEFLIAEPDGGIGFQRSDGRFMSQDVARYQQAIASLAKNHLLDQLPPPNQQRRFLLEIGGGYGGMALHLSRLLPNTTLIIVDLPETLLFSASYLALLRPESPHLIYQPGQFPNPASRADLQNYDFVFVPGYRLADLRNVKIDLAYNVASFQEMTKTQVEEYLDFLANVRTGALYSWNQDHQPRNSELPDLSALLRARFNVREVVWPEPQQETSSNAPPKGFKHHLKSALKEIAFFTRLVERDPLFIPPADPLPYRELICTPRATPVGGGGA